MSTQHYAFTFWGIKLKRNDLYKMTTERLSCNCSPSTHDVFPDARFCPGCGKALTRTGQVPIPGFDDESCLFYAYDVRTRRHVEEAYVGRLLSETTNNAYHLSAAPESFQPCDIPNAEWCDGLIRQLIKVGIMGFGIADMRLHTLLESH